MQQKITPFLWFENRAEEAVNFYISLFKDSKIISINYYPDEMAEMKGKVLTAVFELNGQQFMALDGGPTFKFNESISFYVTCDTQAEIDEFWTKLTADGGQESQCGWLKDKFGVSWQIIPPILGELLSDADKTKSGRVMQCMLKMKKIEIQQLKDAYDGK